MRPVANTNILRAYSLRWDASCWTTDSWKASLARLQSAGINTLLLDISEHSSMFIESAGGVLAERHGECQENFPERLHAILAETRAAGILPAPMYNFSPFRESWRMPGTDCAASIAGIHAFFGSPGLFHLGMDGDAVPFLRTYRQDAALREAAYWETLPSLVAAVERCGARPWLWADRALTLPEAYWKYMPASTIQSHWHPDRAFFPEDPYTALYERLDEHGFSQIPATGAPLDDAAAMRRFAVHCASRIAPGRLLGFLQT